jgi:hypothetical protein
MKSKNAEVTDELSVINTNIISNSTLSDYEHELARKIGRLKFIGEAEYEKERLHQERMLNELRIEYREKLVTLEPEAKNLEIEVISLRGELKRLNEDIEQNRRYLDGLKEDGEPTEEAIKFIQQIDNELGKDLAEPFRKLVRTMVFYYALHSYYCVTIEDLYTMFGKTVVDATIVELLTWRVIQRSKASHFEHFPYVVSYTGIRELGYREIQRGDDGGWFEKSCEGKKKPMKNFAEKFLELPDSGYIRCNTNHPWLRDFVPSELQSCKFWQWIKERIATGKTVCHRVRMGNA